MSDGPHKSLPMRRGWKRVAECGDNRAFSVEEVGTAIVSALEEDCRNELASGFVEDLHHLCREQEAALFKDQLGLQLEGLREAAGHALGRVVLDHAILLSENGEKGSAIAEQALMHAFEDRAARGARQVEEHYCRESRLSHANDVRARIEDAIGNSSQVFNALAQRILGIQSAPASPSFRQQGLDDGVSL